MIPEEIKSAILRIFPQIGVNIEWDKIKIEKKTVLELNPSKLNPGEMTIIEVTSTKKTYAVLNKGGIDIITRELN
jgi:N-dimethylarginine dimethylaminohydrolase